MIEMQVEIVDGKTETVQYEDASRTWLFRGKEYHSREAMALAYEEAIKEAERQEVELVRG